MPIERVFLGWDGPCLPRAAAWLRERYTRGNTWDMGQVLVVTAGATAGKRLLEILVDLAGPLVLFPPSFLTPGGLPERLYEPTTPIADDLQCLLARMQALRRADAGVLRRVVASPPQAGERNVAAWLALARDLESVYEALAAGGVTVEQVPALCGGIVDFREQDRWDALEALQREYERVLERMGLQDRHAARLAALARGECRAAGDIVLVAAADLDSLARRMVMQAGDRIVALVHAPETEAEAFDEAGCLIPQRWAERTVEFDPAIVRVLDRPRDQAYEVLRLLEEEGLAGLGGGAGRYAADEVTVGLGDEAMASLVERALDFAGVAAQTCVGRPVGQTAPGLLLAGVARYFGRQRFDDLAALLRHPDLEAHLLHALGPGAGTADWLTLLDRYITDHLQGASTNTWLGDPARAARLKAVHAAVHALAPPDFVRPRPLPLWSGPIAAALERVYGRRTLSRADAGDLIVIRALRVIGDALREQAALPPGGEATPRVDFSEAILFTLGRIAEQSILPDAGGAAAVEILRWLDLQLDDAPALIITGVNEGRIPESVVTDAFLPDHVRRALGLTDNRRRYARDLMMLTAILHSRRDVRLLTGRRGADEDPLTPSRLLLACAADKLPERILGFYGDAADGRPVEPPPLLPHGPRSRFIIPPPAPAAPLSSLRVTAFRDYIACPYRFYLRHVLRLEGLDDHATELDAVTFGNLAHEALQAFGTSELADSADADAIETFLSQQLDRLARRAFGSEPPAAVRLQLEQLRWRLHALAHWQAQQSREGWRLIPQRIEAGFSAEFAVDGVPFTLTGRIDRIDRHPEQGTRILDYKTGDTGKSPDRIHRGGGEWTDLQLPLYALLTAGLRLGAPVRLGFVQIPKDPRRVGLSLADWSPEELAGAVEAAREVVRKIRRGEFWPPKKPSPYVDEYGRVCMDECVDRNEAIAAAAVRRIEPSAAATADGNPPEEDRKAKR